jgi:hypothetical protein
LKDGNGAFFTADFKVLFELTCRYRDAKALADAYRNLTEVLPNHEVPKELLSKEATAKKDFAVTFKSVWDSRSAR